MDVGAEGKSVCGGDDDDGLGGGESGRSCVGMDGNVGASVAAFDVVPFFGGSLALGEGSSSSFPPSCFSSSTSSRICCRKASASASSSLSSSSFDLVRSSGDAATMGFNPFSCFPSCWLSSAGNARFASARSF